MPATNTTRPTSLVFVPGSWHSPDCYDKIINILQEERRIRCRKVHLASASSDPQATFKDDLDAARAEVVDELEAGRNVVVVAHSYGGMVGCSVIKGLTRTTTASQPQSPDRGVIIGLILIASGFAITGWSFMDPFFGRPPPAWRKNTATGFAEIVVDPKQLFYHDVDSAEADYWVSRLTNHSLKSLFEGGEHVYAGWLDVPSWYIGTIEDHGLPIAAQRLSVGLARGMGADVQHRELKSSHSPFLSLPGDTSRIIAEAVEDFKAGNIDVQIHLRRRQGDLVKLWPHRWYRAGLLKGTGEFIGRLVWTLSWLRGAAGSVLGLFWRAR